MADGDKVLITNVDENIQVYGEFEDFLNKNEYIVIDLPILGENLGKEILDNYKDEIKMENGEFDYSIIYEKIDEEVTNDLINEIYGYVEEYLYNNF